MTDLIRCPGCELIAAEQAALSKVEERSTRGVKIILKQNTEEDDDNGR